MRLILALTLMLITALPAQLQAQDWAAPLDGVPRFETCLPDQMELFEQSLFAPTLYGNHIPIEAFNGHWVQHCGYLAIGLCDVDDSAFTCHRRLRLGWARQAEMLRMSLPDPSELQGQPLGTLYNRLYRVAGGTNAGDDCDGQIARRASWCQAFYQVLKLEEAIRAWQVARLAGAVAPMNWEMLVAIRHE